MRKPQISTSESKRKSAFVGSYVCNILSAFAGSGGVYFFLSEYTENIIVLIFSVVAIMFLVELLKRFAATKCLEEVFQPRKFPVFACTLLMFLPLGSIISSYEGNRQLMVEFSDPPVLVDVDFYTKEYKEKITQIDKQIVKATKTSKKTTDKLTNQRQILQERIFDIEDQIRTENTRALEADFIEIRDWAYYIALATFGCQVLFMFCLYYLEGSKDRSYGVFGQHGIRVEDKKDTLQTGLIAEYKPFVRSIVKEEMNVLTAEYKPLILSMVKEEINVLVAGIKKMQSERKHETIKRATPKTASQDLPQNGEPQKKVIQEEKIIEEPGEINQSIIRPEGDGYRHYTDQVNPVSEDQMTVPTKDVVVNTETSESLQEEETSEATFQASRAASKKMSHEISLSRTEQIESLEVAINNERSKIRTAEYRLKQGIGKPETNRQNIQKANEEMMKLLQILEEVKERTLSVDRKNRLKL